MTPPNGPQTWHWVEYLIEAWGLGLFMIAAGVAATLLYSPAFSIHTLITSDLLRRLLMGLAMGGTAIGLIYSKWGAKSGAHLNPALTLTFAALGKIRHRDAAMYVVAQFAGGLIGVLLVRAGMGSAFASPPVNYVVTVPGPLGPWVAFAAEVLISALLMTTTLLVSNQPRWMRYTGLCCGLLITAFVTFESPLSGMSMNPARTVASALPSGIWNSAWIYFVAPLVGMFATAFTFRWVKGHEHIKCAKLNHDIDEPCLFNCAFRAHGQHVPTLIRTASKAVAS